MSGGVVQSHGPDGVIVDELLLSNLEIEHDRVFGKEGWRAPAMQEGRKDGLARSVLMLVREVRSLRAQLAEKKAK